MPWASESRRGSICRPPIDTSCGQQSGGPVRFGRLAPVVHAETVIRPTRCVQVTQIGDTVWQPAIRQTGGGERVRSGGGGVAERTGRPAAAGGCGQAAVASQSGRADRRTGGGRPSSGGTETADTGGMRALSIRQPYAELILRDACSRQIKPIEFRSRPTTIIGERFYIYASRQWAKGKLYLEGCRPKPEESVVSGPLSVVKKAWSIDLAGCTTVVATGQIADNAEA
jgi:hypothetical protein